MSARAISFLALQVLIGVVLYLSFLVVAAATCRALVRGVCRVIEKRRRA